MEEEYYNTNTIKSGVMNMNIGTGQDSKCGSALITPECVTRIPDSVRAVLVENLGEDLFNALREASQFKEEFEKRKKSVVGQ